MLSVIIIILLLGIIAYLVLDKKNVKMDDVKTFLKDSGIKLKEESGPLLEKVKESFASAPDRNLTGTPTNGMPVPVAAGESYFDGGLLQLIGWTILGILVTALTFGICAPWAFTVKYNWETKHTVINGRRLQFDGTALQLFGNWIKWLILTVITLGIYGLWLPIKLKMWRTKHTSFSGYAYSPAPATEENIGTNGDEPSVVNADSSDATVEKEE